MRPKDRSPAPESDAAPHPHLVPALAQPIGWATRGSGPHLWDSRGQRRLDLAGGAGVNILGHCHPKVSRAIAAQASTLIHCGPSLGHSPYAQLATRLAALGAGEQIFFCNSGAEAIEAALKLARLHFHRQGKPRGHFVACQRGFHGRTLGALAVTGQPQLQAGFGPPLPGARFVPFDDLTALAAAVDHDTAAVLVEPVQGNAGVVPAAPGYLWGAQEICRAAGALLIVDEVQTGIARTGDWFAFAAAGIRPDILCLAKALGGGLPLGACALSAEVAQAFTRGSHGTTFGGNPIACAAGLATLEVIQSENLLAHARVLDAQMRAAAGPGGPLAGDRLRAPLRGLGALWGLPVGEGQASRVQRALWERHVWVSVAGGQTVRLFLPLTLSTELLAEALAVIGTALAAHRS